MISIHALRVEGDLHNIVQVRLFLRISIHALRVEGDRCRHRQPALCPDFYPRPPGGGRLVLPHLPQLVHGDFYPRPPGGGRQRAPGHLRLFARHFYPRPPGGGRPEVFGPVLGNALFLSTPSGWRATPAVGVRRDRLEISIHALRVEGDTMLGSACRLKMHFYPRPPGGGRQIPIETPLTPDENFYPRPPGGGRRIIICVHPMSATISIHALRVEGDMITISTRDYTKISIHALRVEGDGTAGFYDTLPDDFYPRPPGGGRHIRADAQQKRIAFLSTPSGWRATAM